MVNIKLRKDVYLREKGRGWDTGGAQRASKILVPDFLCLVSLARFQLPTVNHDPKILNRKFPK